MVDGENWTFPLLFSPPSGYGGERERRGDNRRVFCLLRSHTQFSSLLLSLFPFLRRTNSFFAFSTSDRFEKRGKRRRRKSFSFFSEKGRRGRGKRGGQKLATFAHLVPFLPFSAVRERRRCVRPLLGAPPTYLPLQTTQQKSVGCQKTCPKVSRRPAWETVFWAALEVFKKAFSYLIFISFRLPLSLPRQCCS